MIYFYKMHHKPPDGIEQINTTSRSNNWSVNLSPFFLGPIKLYGDFISKNMENAWQYSKVYEYYLEKDGSVGDRYFNWAQDGWNNTRAVRYPMGKDAKPLYSYWNGDKLDYVSARKKIYLPLYAEAVQKTNAFQILKRKYEEGDICLFDFDVHNVTSGTIDYYEIINDPTKKFGHAYVLGMLLEGKL